MVMVMAMTMLTKVKLAIVVFFFFIETLVLRNDRIVFFFLALDACVLSMVGLDMSLLSILL